MRFLDRLFRRHDEEPHPGLQGEEYEAQQMARRAAERREAFAENVIKKFGHKALPFLDDPYT
jgi:hypothetical protein